MKNAAMFVRSMAIYFRNFDYSRYYWRNLDQSKIVYLFRILTHPFETLSDIKYEKKGSLPLANLIMLLLFLKSVAAYSMTGFVFNLNQPDDFNLLMEFVKSDALLILWCVSNWMVCTIIDGEGKFSEIWISAWYAMLPKVLLSIPALWMSNMLLKSEAAFLNLFDAAATVWSMVLILIATLTIQQFTLKKTIISMLLTVFFMGVVVFIGILFFSFFQQFLSFLTTIYKELLYRI